MTEREALTLTLAALKQIDEAMPFPVAKLAIKKAEEALAFPKRKPLTDEQIESLEALCIDPVDTSGWGFLNHIRFARAIEAAHGIKENT